MRIKTKKNNFLKNSGNHFNTKRNYDRTEGRGGRYKKRDRFENDSEIDSDDILSSVDSDTNKKIVDKTSNIENEEDILNEISHLKKKGSIYIGENDEEEEEEEGTKDKNGVMDLEEDEDNADIFMNEHSRKLYLAKKYLKELGVDSDCSKSSASDVHEENEDGLFDNVSEYNDDNDENEKINGDKKKEITNRLMEKDKLQRKNTMFQLNKKIKIIADKKMSRNNNNINKKNYEQNEKVDRNKKGDERIIFYKGHKGNVTCLACPNYGLSFFDHYSFANVEKPKTYDGFNSGKFYEVSNKQDSSDDEEESIKMEIELQQKENEEEYEDTEYGTDQQTRKFKNEKAEKMLEPKLYPNTNMRTVYTGGNDRCIIEWDIKRGEKIHIYRGQFDSFLKYGETPIPHFKGVMDICCDKYNSYFISVGCDNLINMWDSRDKKKCNKSYIGHKHIITGIENCVNSAGESTDDYTYYTSSYDKTIKQWDIRFFDRCINTYYGHTSSILNMDSANNLSDIVTGSSDYTMRVWNVKLDSHLIFNLNYETIDSCCALNNSIFVAGTFSGSIYVFSKSYKNPLVIKQNVHSKKPVTALISIPLTNVFISGSYDGFIHFWKYKSVNKKTGIIKKFHSIPLNGVVNKFSFSHNYKYLFIAVGNQMKHGCWIRTKDKMGLAIIPLQFLA